MGALLPDPPINSNRKVAERTNDPGEFMRWDHPDAEMAVAWSIGMIFQLLYEGLPQSLHCIEPDRLPGILVTGDWRSAHQNAVK